MVLLGNIILDILIIAGKLLVILFIIGPDGLTNGIVLHSQELQLGVLHPTLLMIGQNRLDHDIHPIVHNLFA